ncbi:putative polyketide synthase [Stachybotrys elegans]|uniref:Polyketide synthase n=1 Tax=Stachybotrys elegans TaxID=80388 RepID=A0A8K0SYI3_9HYPO|nr:putative polyketide synthase [Stachybotrys elegans]
MSTNNEPIAIIGSGCRFAGGVNSPSSLWEILRQPRDVRQVIPESRFNPAGFYHPDGSHHGSTDVQHAYLLRDSPGAFDAGFFGIKPVEAKAMDPQQRLLMEVTYEALERAGVPIDKLRGTDTGVYVGAMSHDYNAIMFRDLSNLPTYTATGSGASILSNRLSHFFDLKGPSITVDTACSSSLVAVHLAVQALRSGDSRVALACGSNLILGPESFVMESKLKMLSPDGQSRMWDAEANGYARGEGIGVLVLKTLRAALEDGDHIESVIRETALNQDGASNYGGITMPNPAAQEALIRTTYAKAGLELQDVANHPQFFEAHGTGTPAGDPAEAEAIFRAFGASREADGTGSVGPLLVGSLKTVLGHTEGVAGVASLMKVSLALQHRLIPPNLLFNQLSDRVAPFYKGVKIPTETQPWLEGSGQTMRASVNSFGFGGANAHAIVESYENGKYSNSERGSHIFTPFVFSAFTENSLRKTLVAYATFLDGQGSYINPDDLAWTLRERRSILPCRVSIPASSIEDLSHQINEKLDKDNIGTKALPASRKRKILGIFTGQGAQYALMGAELVEASATASRIIETLDEILSQLPDKPSWSLKAELLADPSSSRLNEAAISQPLCTAIQIMLVDLLQLADVKFDAVVGHSSGEIAAAYAAGYLSAKDAICIAYYRGIHLACASSPNGQHIGGAMLAVGDSAESMEELCSDPVFSGRISIAAVNSASSVTLAGDEDAITEMETLLEDEDVFRRRLKVDRAYHSAHMMPCVSPYLDSLVRHGIQPQKPASSCIWISSVYGRPVDSTMDLSGTYWADNMARPVLFSLAVENAVGLLEGGPDLVIEVGAHPALKSPCSQTLQTSTQREAPYTGLLKRGANAIRALSTGLGFIWEHLEAGRVCLDRYEQALNSFQGRFNVVKDAPSYSWDHDNEHWHESRTSKKFRRRRDPPHCLLGSSATDSAPHHAIWKNVLHVHELDWMSGHQLQGQIVFPAAGYLTTAIEATRSLATTLGKSIRLIDIENFVAHQAMFFEKDDLGIEVLIRLADITVDEKAGRIRARFTYSAALPSNPDELTLTASADVHVILGPASSSILPLRKPAPSRMVQVIADRFYEALAELGYGFGGSFRSLRELKRRHLRSSCVVDMRCHKDLLVHPSELDSMLQSCILAYCYPRDESLRSLHLPTSIRRIRVNPSALPWSRDVLSDCTEYILDAVIHPPKPNERAICGDVNLSPGQGSHGAIQVQEATFLPLGVQGESQDRKIFSKTHWINASVDELAVSQAIPLIDEHEKMVRLLEQTAVFYLRQFERDIASDDPLREEFPYNHYLRHARLTTAMVESGQHKWVEPHWLYDTRDSLIEAAGSMSGAVDFEIMHLVGTHMPRVFRGETTMLEEFRKSGVLDRYYAEGSMMKVSTQWVSQAIRQIADRYPHMNIIEIGAGTGGATKEITRNLGPDFRSYTYTDISAAFFENASQTFSPYGGRMIYKTLDAERDPTVQGYSAAAYDLVVAFFVVHATSDLVTTLRSIRKLLRPGGFLVLGEGLGGLDGLASSSFIFGTLPGWWLGVGKEGRSDHSPHVSPEQWDSLLLDSGFSKADISVPTQWKEVLSAYNFVAQAVDETVQFLREPLGYPVGCIAPVAKLIIVGGRTRRSSHLVTELESILASFSTEVCTYQSLTDIDFANNIDARSTILCLTDLDQPILKDITPETFAALKTLFRVGKKMFWVTSGRLDIDPFSNMMTGFGRVAVNELLDLRLQQLDIANPATASPRIVAECFLRFHASEFQDEQTLWSLESELVLDTHDKLLLPRLRTIPEVNSRYNSTKRIVAQQKKLCSSPIIVQPSFHEVSINDLSPWEIAVSKTNISPDDTLELRTTHASFSAIRTPVGHKFVALGVCSKTGTTFLALVTTLASILVLPSSSAIQAEVAPGTEHDLLATLVARLIASTVLTGCAEQTVVVHNASRILAWAFTAEAAVSNVNIVFTVDSNTMMIENSWVRLPEYVTRSDLSYLLPSTPVAFASFSSHETASSSQEADLISNLPPYCRVDTLKTLISPLAGPSTGLVLKEILGTTLESLQDDIKRGKRLPLAEHPTISLSELSDGLVVGEALSIIDFRCEAVSVQSTRIDARPMFKGKDSTYWIAGMTGVLGVSLCDWMINNGARNIVMTSRNPDIPADWVEAHSKEGVNVVAFSCDLTVEAEVIAAHESIRGALPLVVGVLNGAMVLQDVAIRDMSFEQFMAVTKPKVDGSIFLDRVFHDIDLDFFVMVASINCVVGSWGQANYAAANMFMCSLAAQRRKRGLRAAAVNAGAIIGAGYMERESRRTLEIVVEKLYLTRLSEEDWHQIICEAIDASRLDATAHGPELTTGLSRVPFDAPDAPVWFKNPTFSEFIIYDEGVRQETGQVQEAVSVQEMLEGCSSIDDVQRVVTSTFCNQLRSILQVTTSDVDLLVARSSEIGLDSLVSLDLQTWILKNLQVNIPVFKIMGNHAMSQLVEYIVENMPPDMFSHEQSLPSAPHNKEAATTPDGPQVSETRANGAGRAEGYDAKPNGVESIDWEAEVSLPLEWAPTFAGSTPPPCSPPRIIVITGVTGLLGHHLLDSLLEQETTTAIHCLAVRDLKRRQGNELRVDARVKYYPGNLGDPLLGLSEPDAQFIFSTADVVIHNGADTSHVKLYQDVRAANVGSTKSLIRLCLPRRIPFHYVSSAGVALYANLDSFPPISATGLGSSYPASDGSFGYGSSKWVSERILEQIHAKHGLPVVIHRPSTILRENADAVTTRAQIDWVNALMAYIRLLGVAPKIQHNTGSMDLVRIETCCRKILEWTQRSDVELTYVHEVGDVVVPLNRLQDLDTDAETGKQYGTMPMSEWIEKAIAAGLHRGVALLVEEMDSPESANWPKLLPGEAAKQAQNGDM